MNVMTISGYTFDGPYSSVADLCDKSGLYAILCMIDDGYVLVSVEEASSILVSATKHPVVHDSSIQRKLHGKLAFAMYPTPSISQTIRESIRNEIRKECLPIYGCN